MTTRCHDDNEESIVIDSEVIMIEFVSEREREKKNRLTNVDEHEFSGKWKLLEVFFNQSMQGVRSFL